jgi:hypothetical protein
MTSKETDGQNESSVLFPKLVFFPAHNTQLYKQTTQRQQSIPFLKVIPNTLSKVLKEVLLETYCW